jgi:hypothetical protein
LLFAHGVVAFSDSHPIGAPFLCFLYPILVGVQKGILFAVVKPFEMEEVYEFSSLAFAAMPYRFLWLGYN